VLGLFHLTLYLTLILKIEKIGVEFETYSSTLVIPKTGKAQEEEKKIKPVYRIANGDDVKEVFNLKEILAYIKEVVKV
jgi:hypothetical protein